MIDEGTSRAPRVEESCEVRRFVGGSWWPGLKQGAEPGREAHKQALSPLAAGILLEFAKHHLHAICG